MLLFKIWEKTGPRIIRIDNTYKGFDNLTILDLKKLISRQEDIPVEALTIVLDGISCDDNHKTLNELQFYDFDMAHITIGPIVPIKNVVADERSIEQQQQQALQKRIRFRPFIYGPVDEVETMLKDIPECLKELIPLERKGKMLSLTPIQYACEQESWEVVSYIIENYSCTENDPERFGDVLNQVLLREKFDYALKLLDKKNRHINLEMVNLYNTNLHLAVRHNRFDIVELLIQKGADYNAKSVHGLTVGESISTDKQKNQLGNILFNAMNNNDIERVINLLKFCPKMLCEIKPFQIDENKTVNSSLIVAAAYSEKWDLVKAIAENFAPTEGDPQKFGQALLVAIEIKQFDSANILLNHPLISFNVAPTNEGNTALHWAVIHNQPALVKKLLQSGADYDKKNLEGKIAAAYVTRGSEYSATRKALKTGLRGMLSATGWGNSLAAGTENVGRFFSDKKKNQINDILRTADTKNDIEGIIKLLKRNPKMLRKEESFQTDENKTVKRTLIVAAAYSENWDLVKAIAENCKPTKNDPQKFGQALVVAIKNKQFECANILLTHPLISVYVITKDGNTALHWAVMHNQPALVKKLLQSGADYDKRNVEGKIAVDYTKTPDMQKEFSERITEKSRAIWSTSPQSTGDNDRVFHADSNDLGL